MSSVVTAPEGPSPRLSQTTPPSRLSRRGPSADFMLGLLGAVLLSLVDFIAAGGNDLAPNTWVQGGLIALAAGVAVLVVVIGAKGRFWGAGTLILFGALAVLTYASIAWSVQPADSWLEANRTLSYLAGFATALLLARLAPNRWRALTGAVATAATVASGYALLAKVFPGTLDPHDPLGRLRAPFDYWNAVGLTAAMGLPACLWAGSRQEPSRVLRTLTAPAIAVLVAAVVLSFSRGAVLVAVIGLAVWFALAPLRLRSAVFLLVGGAGGAAIASWGAAHAGVSADKVATATRISAGHSFGLVILVALILTAAAGLAVSLALDRIAVAAPVRRRIGLVMIGLVGLIPVGGVVALASSSRGFSGEVSHLWRTLTSTNGGVGNKPGRLVDLSNSRPHYWSIAFKLGANHPLAGVGALGFATAQARYSRGSASFAHVTHAHGYVMETFADFGAIGLAISLALLLAWVLATARTFELGWSARGVRVARPPPAPEHFAERAGLIALLVVVVTFGVHSLIDWTWFIPGDAVAALVCAGWLVGRGPLSRPVGRLPHRRALSRSPASIGVLAPIAVIALLAIWGIAQPLRSFDAYAAAIASPNAGVALTDARTAASVDPVSIDPLFLLSHIYTVLGNTTLGRRELAAAVSRQPGNPKTWEELGCYDLFVHHFRRGTRELHHALTLEPGQTLIKSDATLFCALLAS